MNNGFQSKVGIDIIIELKIDDSLVAKMRPFNALATEVVRCVKGDATDENMKITGMISRIPRCGAIALRTSNGNRRHIVEVRMRALLG